MAESAPRNNAKPATTQPSIIGLTLSALGQSVLWLILALLIAILLEWLGLTWLWPQEGAGHSARLLEQALAFLSRDFKSSLLTHSPAAFAQGFVQGVYYGAEVTGLAGLIKQITIHASLPQQPLHPILSWLYPHLANYSLAAINTACVFAVRLAILTLSLPAILLLVLVALVDGLAQRDIRRWSGGRESAFVYHWVKQLFKPVLSLPWLVYLALPLTIHPNLIVLPFAIALSWVIWMLAATFKKHL